MCWEEGGMAMCTLVRLQLCETDHSRALACTSGEIREVSMWKLRTAM